MATKTIDQLAAAAAALTTQELEVYDPAGSPKSQKVTGAQLKTLCGSAPTVTDFATVFGSMPHAAGTYSFTNTTGHVLLITFGGFFDLTGGGSEGLEVDIGALQVAAAGFLDAGYNTNTLTDKAGFQITFLIDISVTFSLILSDDATTAAFFAQIVKF